MATADIAFLFPGQGSQYSGMGSSLARAYPEAREVFDLADQTLGFSLSELCFSGSGEDLTRTENTQPAVLSTAVAASCVLIGRGITPAYVAGHSLGEYGALVAAGAIPFDAAVDLVRKRGRYMQEAVPEGEGAMAAILGLGADEVSSVCAAAANGAIVQPANFNSPIQVVIAGHRDAVERAVDESKARGARKAMVLPVSAPFHCALMAPVEERLRLDLDRLEFRDLAIPLVTNVDARIIRSGEAARDALKRQPSRPVRWQETIELLLRSGVTTFVEVGPGKVLSGLVRSIEKSVTMLHAEDEESVDRTLAALAGRGTRAQSQS
jgi:[acyl-carrier-protein] S-malonyltransferase